MFFQPSIINNLLKCQHCFQSYNIYDQPRILPCCGKTLCTKCFLLIEKELKDNKFKCILCREEYLVPPKGFPINEMAIKLLSEQPAEVSRGKESEKLKKNISDLEQLVKKLMFEIDNAEFSLDDHFKEQERLVQLAAEELVQEIYKRRDVLMKELSDHRKTCSQNCAKIEQFREKTNEIANQVNSQLEKEKVYLNQFQIEDKKINDSNEKLNLLISVVENQRFLIKNALFDNNLMQFMPVNRSRDEIILGSIDFEKIVQKKTVSK